MSGLDVLGADWGAGDVAATIFSGGAYGIYKAAHDAGFNQDPSSSSGFTYDPRQSTAYQAAVARGASSDAALAAAREQLAAVKAQVHAAYTPIAVNVPSFSLSPLPSGSPDVVGWDWKDSLAAIFTGGASAPLSAHYEAAQSWWDKRNATEAVPTAGDPRQTAAYQAAVSRGANADQALAAARQHAATRSAPRAAYTPIAINVPSFGVPSAPPPSGFDMLGAVLIQVKDPLGVAAKQGGTKGAIAARLIPQTVTSTVDSEIASKLKPGFAEQGVDVDVSIVPNTTWPKPPGSDLLAGVGIGAVGLVALWAAWKLLF